MTDAWTPTLDDQPGALYERILRALEHDARTGALARGQRLPPQRILAHRLGLSVGTVTKAYLEAERRGLVTGQVGRGTFVADPRPGRAAASDADRVIDLSRNVIPNQSAVRHLTGLKRHPEFQNVLDYAQPAGPDRHRRAAAIWLQRTARISIPWERLVLTTGAQQAMWLSLGVICRPGDTVLCENATYYGLKSIAELNGYKLTGIAMDEEGVTPDALETAARRTGAKAVYLMPTMQNPTGKTMGKARREAIAEVARRLQLWVLEDDNYSLFAPEDEGPPPPISALAPDRCFYISGASKCISPGLRLGFLGCPSEAHLEAVIRIVRATIYSPSAFGGLIFTSWVEDGVAYQIAQDVLREVLRRTAVAREVLPPEYAARVVAAPHLWLPMPELEAERAAGRALRAGVLVTPPDAPVVGARSLTGVRVCLGGAADVEEVRIGLGRLQQALGPVDRAETATI